MLIDTARRAAIDSAQTYGPREEHAKRSGHRHNACRPDTRHMRRSRHRQRKRQKLEIRLQMLNVRRFAALHQAAIDSLHRIERANVLVTFHLSKKR
jgi:hypothetical protein